MNTTHVYFRPATPQQRKLLFEEWEATKSVTKACQKAHVSRMTFYLWKPRFLKEGYDGLEQAHSHAPHHHPLKKDANLEARVVRIRGVHPDWGKKRIAQELAKENNWVSLVSANTVRRILEAAQLWMSSQEGKKEGAQGENR
jgi:transposase